jgi:hypothetical protein
MTAPHPVPQVVGQLFQLVRAEVETRRLANPSNPDTIIRVDLGDPGRFEEFHAIGVGLATVPVGPVEDRGPLRRTPGADNHDVDVLCVALSWTGDDDRLAWMTKAFGLVDIVRDVLAANPGLGLDKVVETAWVDSTTFSWATEGLTASKAVVEFMVRVRAYRSRRR